MVVPPGPGGTRLLCLGPRTGAGPHPGLHGRAHHTGRADLLARQRTQPDIWVELPEIRELKEKARQAGLWNLFLPEISGLSNVEYATLAEQMGRSFIAPEIFNCNAPDTGNMEVLAKYGTEAQKERWLEPLLEGRIRSAFCMTEPDVASSDATNMQATATVDGDEIVINGRKWWSTGIGHPDCEVIIFMGLTDPEAHRHSRHSMVLVPKNTPGVKVERMLTVFGDHDRPTVTVRSRSPTSGCRWRTSSSARAGLRDRPGPPGPGHIHHYMHLIGAGVALELDRRTIGVAFGRPLSSLGGNRDVAGTDEHRDGASADAKGACPSASTSSAR